LSDEIDRLKTEYEELRKKDFVQFSEIEKKITEHHEELSTRHTKITKLDITIKDLTTEATKLKDTITGLE
jgi:uncharacterized coiled-coil DUF342 family protein